MIKGAEIWFPYVAIGWKILPLPNPLIRFEIIPGPSPSEQDHIIDQSGAADLHCQGGKSRFLDLL
jgi:hypothetical protein